MIGRFLRRCWAFLGAVILWVARVIGGAELERWVASLSLLQGALLFLGPLVLLWLIAGAVIGIRRWRERRNSEPS